MSGLVEINHQGRMIGRHRLPLPGFPVDFSQNDALGQRRRNQQMINPHPEILMEITRPVIPPRVPIGFRMPQPVSIDESRTAESRKRIAFRFGNVRSAMAHARIPDIDIRRRYVEIAAEHDGCAVRNRLLQPLQELPEPDKFGLIKRRSDHAAVRRVYTHDADAAALRGNHSCFGKRFIIARVGRTGRPQRLSEIGDDAANPDPARDRDTVPSPFAVVRELVSRLTECLNRSVRIGKFCLLHQEDIGLRAVQPPLNLLETRLQRIDIPGCDPHIELRRMTLPYCLRPIDNRGEVRWDGMVSVFNRVILLLSVFFLIGNASAREQDQVLRTQTTVVLAPTLVKDTKGKLIFGLRANDFTIEDDGVEQTLQLDEILDVQPVSLVVALQCGGAAAAEFERMQGLGAMLGPVLEQGNTDVAIVEFDSKVALIRDFTRDEKAIRNDLRRLRPGDGGAAILDAVNYSVSMLNKTPNDRLRMLLLISETRDHGSAVPLANVATTMAGSDIVMYALAFSPALSQVLDDVRGKNPGKSNNADILAPILMAAQGMKKNIPKAIATMTGGQYELFKSGKNFELRMNQFDNDLYNRYLLSFQPSDPRPGLHKVEVKLTTPRKHVTVIARNSYWAAPPPRSRGIRESENQ